MRSDWIVKLLLGFIVLTFEILWADFAYSERYVTVAAIGNTPDLIDNENKQEIVDYVIDFWERELKKVLKASPDLIVLPEFCDLSTAGVDYMKVRKNQILKYFASVAKRNKCYIAFGMGRKDKKGYWRIHLPIIFYRINLQRLSFGDKKSIR
jgi:hypothetical protein